jgi:hypothetical protein
MMKILMTMMIAAGVALAAGCDKSSTSSTTTTTKTEAKTPEGTKTTETKVESKVTETPKTGDIGVAECDEYVQKMADCSNKVPAAAGQPMKDSLETMKKAWKDAATTPESKTALASACKQALDSSKSAYASMGCTF